MKNSDKYLKNLLRKTINETFEDKTNKLMGKIKRMEMEEAFGDMEGYGDNTPNFDSKNFETITDLKSTFGKSHDWEGGSKENIGLKRKKTRLCKNMTTQECLDSILDKISYEGYENLTDEEKDFLKNNRGGGDLVTEGEMCECGGMMKEGECMECGSMREEFNEQEEEENVFTSDEVLCDFNRKHFGEDDEETIKACKNVKNINERLYGDQGKIDRNKNKRIDSEDLKLLRKSKKHKSEVEEDEMEEGNKFTKMLAKARKGDKFSMNGKNYTDTSDYDVNEGIEYHIQDKFGDVIKLNENEVIDLIENIVLEEKEKGLKSMTKPVGLATYEKAHKASGKENTDYMKSVSTKMKDYLKDGSKGKYDTNPKFFPKGNGQLGDMKKKAFEMTNELEDFNYGIGGQNFPSPDEIGFDEKRMEKYFKGDSTTGNAPGGNALESEANERFNKMRKKNTLKKLKDQSYKRVSQPVFNETSTDEEGKLNIKLESMSQRKVEVIKEEFDRIKELFKYNRKTQ